jgi:hypothetical protein
MIYDSKGKEVIQVRMGFIPSVSIARFHDDAPAILRDAIGFIIHLDKDIDEVPLAAKGGIPRGLFMPEDIQPTTQLPGGG